MQSTTRSKAPAPKSPRTSRKILTHLSLFGPTTTPALSRLYHNGCKINQLLAQLAARGKVVHIGYLTRPGRRPASIWDIPRSASTVA